MTATVTAAPMPAAIRTKIELRILAAMETAPTFRDAVTAAAHEASQEAERNGWSAGARVALVDSFATVAVDLAAGFAATL